MQRLVFMLFLLMLVRVSAQFVNLNPDPEGEPWYAGYVYDAEEEAFLNSLPRLVIKDEVKEQELDPSWDNMNIQGSNNQYFRPIFNQLYTNCAQAALIGYVFTFEINRAKRTSAEDIKNQFPINFTYNFVNGGSGDSGSSFLDAISIASEFGVPSSEIWKEVTGDSLQGPPDIWMSGYDNYLSALNNRIKRNLGSVNGGFVIENNYYYDPERTLEDLKYYLRYHNELDADVGGVLGFSTSRIPMGQYIDISDNEVPMPLLITPITSLPSHAMTVVGYDDTIGYDFNGRNGIMDEDMNGDRVISISEKEVGALKVVNSWDQSWPRGIEGTDGTAYIP